MEVVKKEKNAAAVALGQLGGNARAKKLSKKRLSELARHAIEARWRKIKENQS